MRVILELCLQFPELAVKNILFHAWTDDYKLIAAYPVKVSARKY